MNTGNILVYLWYSGAPPVSTCTSDHPNGP